MYSVSDSDLDQHQALSIKKFVGKNHSNLGSGSRAVSSSISRFSLASPIMKYFSLKRNKLNCQTNKFQTGHNIPRCNSFLFAV